MSKAAAQYIEPVRNAFQSIKIELTVAMVEIIVKCFM